MTNAERIAKIGVAELAQLCFDRCEAEGGCCGECPLVTICHGTLFGKTTAEQWREWLEIEAEDER